MLRGISCITINLFFNSLLFTLCSTVYYQTYVHQSICFIIIYIIIIIITIPKLATSAPKSNTFLAFHSCSGRKMFYQLKGWRKIFSDLFDGNIYYIG